jgi:hypothetical protein
LAVGLLGLSALLPIGAAALSDGWTAAEALSLASVPACLFILLAKLRHRKIVRLALALVFLSLPGTIVALVYLSARASGSPEAL